MEQLTSEHWAGACAADGEFRLAARHWNGGLKFSIGDRVLGLSLTDGEVTPGVPATHSGLLEFTADPAVWDVLLAAEPPRFHNDLIAALTKGAGVSRRGDPLVHAQYYPAVMRALELLRPPPAPAALMPAEAGVMPRVDTPVGRYVHLQLGGEDHRIYFEAAGRGIPLLLQHTAGCHGSQWRHLFEVPEITDHFQLIAYDLPYHGKSLPPVNRAWWSVPYALDGEFLRSVPLQLAAALRLENPVFMGCSVGGLLALDLALRHPDRFRAVIAVEGALKIEGRLADMQELWHPQVSNDYKARVMEGLMAPTSPAAYRKETAFVYASGWSPAFLGDLHYYMHEFDLRAHAREIDTRQVGVHLLSGEYDYSASVELGRAAHAAIAGSTFVEMPGMGHFPMSENPAVFLDYLRPILRAIRDADGAGCG